MRRRPTRRQSEWTLIVAMMIVAIVLTVLHHRAGKPGSSGAGSVSFPERAARWVLLPVQGAFTAGWSEVAVTWAGLFQGRRLVEENRRLQAELDEANMELIYRQKERLQYKEMQEKLGFPKPRAAGEVRAKVIGRSGGSSQRQTIDIVAESDQVIDRGDVVKTERGLVGRVVTASQRSATVMLLTDPKSGAPAVVSAAKHSTGVVLGPDPASSDPRLLRLQRLEAGAPVLVGNKVFTSDMGVTYPEGIFIGEIEEVIGRGGPSEPKTALVRPAVDFTDLNYVIVVKWGQ